MRLWRTSDNRGPEGDPAPGRRPGYLRAESADRLPGRRPGYLRPSSIAVAAAAAAALLGTVTGVVAATTAAGPGARQGAAASASSPATATTRAPAVPAHNHRSPGAAPGSLAARGAVSAAATRHVHRAAARSLRTSCQSVAHIGDSTSLDLINSDYIYNPAQRLGARYAAVGVRHLWMDASGGRSIVEALPGQVNGYNVARAWQARGFHGCWVFALGTNDTADVAVGSPVGLAARIGEMMSVAHGQPVIWVNTVTQLSSGYWSNANEYAWDQALVRALHKYPNMRIFNWAAVARPGWFLPDGIHYNSYGAVRRAQAIADALARAFPLHGHSTGQIVR